MNIIGMKNVKSIPENNSLWMINVLKLLNKMWDPIQDLHRSVHIHVLFLNVLKCHLYNSNYIHLRNILNVY